MFSAADPPERPNRTTHDAFDDRHERELIARIQRGEVAAFEQLMERYWTRVCLYVEHFDADTEFAADVSQEVFTRLWKVRQEWNPAGSVGAWLMRTARNLTISEQRRRKVRTRWVLFSRGGESRRPVTPLQATEQAELRSALERAIRELSPRRREAITLYHLQGLSYREIGEIMGIRPQTAANYLQAAFADLRVMLAGFFPALSEIETPAGPESREPGE
jgi:RNA polymerase sigma factor (sigma-70 family)